MRWADGLTWLIEEFAKKNVDPTTCAGSPFTPPSGMVEGGAVTITCSTQADVDNHPTVLLVADATTDAGTSRTIEVMLQVPSAQRTTQVHSWHVVGRCSTGSPDPASDGNGVRTGSDRPEP